MEKIQNTPELPSGYLHTESVVTPLVITSAEMPWLDSPTAINLVKCTLQGGKEFLLGSAIHTDPKLVGAARSMTDQQSTNCNNMFYSRVAGFVEGGLTSPSVDTFPNSATSFPLRVLRNNGGQRVYFGVMRDEQLGLPIIVRIAACDKKMQAQVASLFHSMGAGYQRNRTTK